jgi:glutathione peroxidase
MHKLLVITLLGAGILGVTIMTSTSVNAACSGIYNHEFTTLQGEKINLCAYQDKPILVVNTASI